MSGIFSSLGYSVSTTDSSGSSSGHPRLLELPLDSNIALGRSHEAIEKATIQTILDFKMLSKSRAIFKTFLCRHGFNLNVSTLSPTALKWKTKNFRNEIFFSFDWNKKRMKWSNNKLFKKLSFPFSRNNLEKNSANFNWLRCDGTRMRGREREI